MITNAPSTVTPTADSSLSFWFDFGCAKAGEATTAQTSAITIFFMFCFLVVVFLTKWIQKPGVGAAICIARAKG